MDIYNEMIHFGTGGWRALIGSDFTEYNVRRVAEGIAKLAQEEKKEDKPIVIGYDHRFLSKEASHWVAEVLAQHGLTVWTMNRSAPTPLIMHFVLKKELHYGIEITASHNPSIYNGIKLIVDEGRDAPVSTTQHLEELLQDIVPAPSYTPFSVWVEQGRIISLKNPFNDFLDDILAVLNVPAIREHGARVLFDPMFGSGTYPLLVLLSTARCTVDFIHGGHDAFFGGQMPAPSENSLMELKERVISGQYEIGIALDGDGDRLGILDSNGRYISANEILVMLYWYLHEIKGWQGPVVRNLATTHMLDALAKDFGEECYEVPIGFKYISQKIDETDAVMGGESSGGLTVRGHIHGKDSVYAACLFVEMISVTHKTPSEILDELTSKYGSYVMVEYNIQMTQEQKGIVNHSIMEEKCLPTFNTPIQRVSYEDGCKVYFEDGSFVICRFSGTEPMLRIFAEAKDSKVAESYIEAFKILCVF